MALPSLDGDSKSNKHGLPDVDKGLGLPDILDDGDEYKGEEEYEDFGSSGDGFVDVSVEEVSQENDDSYNDELYKDVDNMEDDNEPELPNMEYSDNVENETEDDYNPDYEEDLEEKESKFIDKKKKRILPFGGNKSKRKVKSSDFDDRKNVLAKTKIVRSILMVIIAFLFLLGLKNTFFPSHVYTDDEIRSFAREGSGQTLFPNERGQAFVENFMQTYLTLDRTRPELTEVLSHYYGEESFAKVGYEKTNLMPGPEVKQNVIIGPSVYDVNLLTDYSALYKVSAYVSDNTGNEVADGSATGKWVSFSINVYYDEAVDGLAITPDSPSIIPSYEIARQADVPDRTEFGNGEINEEIAPAINPTINGFVEAYADSSLESHDSILQYIDDKNDISLYDGFGGSVKLNGTPAESIKRTIYNGDDEIYRVILTVDWVDTEASEGEDSIVYQGKYIMRVNPDGNGKYTVSSFVPYTYYK